MREIKTQADDIMDIEDQDYFLKTLTAYIRPDLPPDIKRALTNRMYYFFGFGLEKP